LGGSTLHYGVTIYDGLAGTYLGQHLLSVARERKREKEGKRNEKRGSPAFSRKSLYNHGSDQSF